MLFYDAAMKPCIYLAVLVMSLQGLLTASDQPNQQDAVSRLEQAAAKTNIFELASFAMKADIQLENNGKIINGTYQFLWNGPDQWREGINFPGYSEVQIGGKGTIWIQRSSDFIPLPIFYLHQALGFSSSIGLPQSMSLVQLALSSKDTIKKTSKRNEHDDKLTCYEIENEQKRSSEICVHDDNGTVARPSFMFADSDLQPVGLKAFPRLLTVRYKDKEAARVNISEISTPAQFPAEAFTPPTGVSPQAGCMNPAPARLVKRQNPEYPQSARLRHREGTVAFDALIGTDGVPQFRKVVESPDPDLEASSRQTLSKWRYDPALCNGQPVGVETLMQVNYALTY
jgi:TonB family protein